jgi:hypothetical protein
MKITSLKAQVWEKGFVISTASDLEPKNVPKRLCKSRLAIQRSARGVVCRPGMGALQHVSYSRKGVLTVSQTLDSHPLEVPLFTPL